MDKIAATRRKGKWTGRMPILGYDVDRSGGRPRLVVNAQTAARVWEIFRLYLSLGVLLPVVEELARRGWRNNRWITRQGVEPGGRALDKNSMWHLLTNVTCLGIVSRRTKPTP